MLKTLAFPLIALMLIFSLLAPSILPLLDKGCDISLVVDTSGEEKNTEKESENKFDEKDLYLSLAFPVKSVSVQNKKMGDVRYFFFNSDFKVEIPPPPPEHFLI